MDKNVAWVKEQKINRTIEALNKNNMNGYFVKDNEELLEKLKELIKDGDKVAFGGSMSIIEAGVLDFLRKGNYELLDRYKEGLTKEEIVDIYKGAFTSDCYIASSNAVTENGELYNVDGNGNRVSAMLYGPEKVILICGINKIVKNVDEAIKRNREFSAPMNARRLNKKTPCAKVGYCMDCKSEDRLCNEYTLIRRQNNKERMHVIFLNDDLGY
ncbi:MAG: lactate utilization protein [Clostridium sp.]|uniref:lactate utilization protein n=1 Tax=Clostridium TaxID=1485 RepID=UPI00215271D4|nr:lactate utilization protein [Clostridium sp. LY3-2]MCR6516178.1 lactate utilization protein [Clostridium sp. LY3-2]